MLRRTLIALVLIPVFTLLLQSAWWVLGLCALVHALAMLELCSLIPGLGSRGRVAQTLFSTVFMCWLAQELSVGRTQGLLLLLLLAIIAYLALSVGQAAAGRDPDTSWLLVRALALISLPMAFLPALLAESRDFPWLLLLVGASWAADTAAILAGKLVGRRPLAAQLSPRKTVEGAVAGIFTAGLCWSLTLLFYWPADGALGLLFSPDGLPPDGPLLHAAALVVMFVLGAVAGMLGILGDLAFSLFKRQAQVKDFSHALPGHGGVLDRVDSMLLLIPVLYALMQGL